ncbi:RsmG family class I SAM-dependent methyltransferase, partial [Acinetobacter baumannii]|uniref:RsmG family class I SAM-dependent methyltransferase n=2 Tax=Bacteria TaxID=2 RepID=UPI0031F4560F
LYADLGTGGGFPGMPMCIMTGRQTLLVDSVQKKVRALEGVAAQLGLGDKVDVYAGRIEDLGRERAGEFS